MFNLAGKNDCDKMIQQELSRAGIKIVSVPKSSGEVPFSVQGEIQTPHGVLTLTRAWTYWVVSGKIPLTLAQKMYAHPEGKASVRVSGHCMCPPPEEWVEYIDSNGKILGKMEELNQLSKDSPIRESILKSETYRFVEDPTTEGLPFITVYHIDDQAGLLLFALMTKESV